MEKKVIKFRKSKFFLPISGLVAGLVNGLLGAGGGIIIVWSLTYALEDCDFDKKDVFANALCVMLPLSAVSCVIYAISGNLSLNGIGVYMIPAILGGIAGSLLLPRLKLSSLKRLFSALVIYSGIILIIK